LSRLSAAAVIAALLLVSPARAADETPFPYELNRGQEIALIGTGALALALSGIAMENQDPLTPDEVAALDPDDVNPIDRSATGNWSPAAADITDILQAAQILSPFLLAVSGRGRQKPAVILTMYIETLALVNGFAQLSKGTTARTRPYVYNDDPEIPEHLKLEVDAVRSFPSGHTVNAFNSAVFLGTVYGKLYPQSAARKWVWASGLTVATATGILRYAAGKHFPTDVITGAIVGSAVGFIVPKVHEVDIVQVGLRRAGPETQISLTHRF
jgi:membrane-associated phospholipid phosphatase